MTTSAMSFVDALPEFAEGLEEEERRAARAELIVPRGDLPVGPWQAPQTHRPGDLGLVIVEGIFVRRMTVAGATSIELLTRTDLLRPWQENESSFTGSEWRALTPVTFARLDRRFTIIAARWPTIVEAVVAAGMRRSRSLAAHAAIESVRGLPERLMILLWHMAERWGTLEPDGVVMPIRLTHEMFAELTGAARPSVSSSLKRLEREGKIRRRRDRSWVLLGDPPGPDGFGGAVS